MPKVRKARPRASARAQNYSYHLTVCSLGLDMVGPFSKSPCHKTHLLVAVDKFTKWVEVEPVSRVDVASAVRFFKKTATRFGYPHSIITDKIGRASCRERVYVLV